MPFSWIETQFGPSPSPDRRWLRAIDIVATKKNASRGRDDEITCQAARYIRKLNRCRTERGFRDLAKREPVITMAVKFHQRAGRPQLEFHCRVLARQTNRAIAREMGLTLDMVATYRALFFDVGEFGAEGHIIRTVIKLPPTGPATLGALAMLAAFTNGPFAIQPWLDYLVHADDIHDLTTAEGRRREAIALVVAARELDSDQLRLSLVKRMPLIFRNHEKTPAARSVAEVFSDRMIGILNELSWKQSDEGPEVSTHAIVAGRHERSPRSIRRTA